MTAKWLSSNPSGAFNVAGTLTAGTVVSTNFLGTFVGNGAGLTNIPTSAIVGYSAGGGSGYTNGNLAGVTLTNGNSITVTGTVTAATLAMTTLNVGTLVVTNAPALNLASSTNLPSSSITGSTWLTPATAGTQISGSNFVTAAQVGTQVSGSNYMTASLVGTQVSGSNYMTAATTGTQIGTSNLITFVQMVAGTNTFSGTNTFTLPITAQGYDCPTNTWAKNTAFGLGTNCHFTSGATTCGITGVVNKSTKTERYGELTIVATGDIIFTNVAGIRCSDFLATRTITNGNSAVISVQLIPGQCTNMAIVQFR